MKKHIFSTIVWLLVVTIIGLVVSNIFDVNLMIAAVAIGISWIFVGMLTLFDED
ncbi:hypothetical protein [Parasphingorhabdus sp.]|uniref:hypothetical protein n=1 Tax=Parasphingorhabdus sp. TaxID=2709688 RepID=UPI003BB0B3B9